MSSRFREIFPKRVTLVSFAVIYALTSLTALLSGLPIDPELKQFMAIPRFFVLVLFCFVCGFRRGRNHPARQPGYEQWLTLSPWRLGNRLPLGPVLPLWEDLIWLGVAVGLTLVDTVVLLNARREVVVVVTALPVAAAAVGYVLTTTATLGRAGRGWYAMAILFLLPLAIYPVLSPAIAACVVAIAFVIAFIGVQRSLANFPWDRPWWTVEPITKFREDFRRGCGGLWPYAHTWPEPVDPWRVPWGALAGSALFTWWLHVFLAVSIRAGFGEWFKFQWVVFVVVMVGAFWIRVASYFRGVRSPLPLRARVRSLRLIVRRYDYAWLAPLACAAAGVATVIGMLGYGLPTSSAIPVSLLLTLALAILLPPELRSWELTSRRCVKKPDYEADVRMQTEIETERFQRS
jgi:hypothetical protein